MITYEFNHTGILSIRIIMNKTINWNTRIFVMNRLRAVSLMLINRQLIYIIDRHPTSAFFVFNITWSAWTWSH